jgi:hypothetical protein
MLVSRRASICAFARISNRFVLRKGVIYIEGRGVDDKEGSRLLL